MAKQSSPAETEPPVDERDLVEAKKVLLEQANVLQLAVDKRWSVDTLAEEVQEAQAAKVAADKAAFEASPGKVWVFLLRDGWAVADINVGLTPVRRQ